MPPELRFDAVLRSSDAGIPLGEEVSAAPVTLGSGTEFDLLPHSRLRSVTCRPQSTLVRAYSTSPCSSPSTRSGHSW
jgi:hypothetical protein